MGLQTHPQKFWFVENPDKIPENPGKNGAQRLQKNKGRPFLERSLQKTSSWSLWEKILKSHNFTSKFGKIRAKILRTSKNLLNCSYTGGFQPMGHDAVFSGPQSFSTINSISAIHSKLRVTTFLSLFWWNLQPYIKHYCRKMLQIWTISVKQFQINFSIQWQC